MMGRSADTSWIADAPSIELQVRREAVTAVSRKGLIVGVGGQKLFLPWAKVSAIGAGRIRAAAQSDYWTLALILSVEVDEEMRVFVVSEIERAWLDVVQGIQDAFLDVEPFEQWGVAVVTGSGYVSLFGRT